MATSSPPIVIDDDDDGGNRQAAAPPAGTAARADAMPAPATAAAAPPTATECAICLEVYDQTHYPVVLRCGHHAGEPCMRDWLRTKRQCPNCRANAKPGHMVRVFNLPTVAAAPAGGGAAPAAAAAGPAPPAGQNQLAEREVMLQAAQRAKARAEEDARRAQQLAQDREAEAKRYKRHVEVLLAEMAAKDKRYQEERVERERSARQAAATACAPPPVLHMQPALQHHAHPPHEQHLQQHPHEQQYPGYHQHHQHQHAWPLQQPHGGPGAAQPPAHGPGQGPQHQSAPGTALGGWSQPPGGSGPAAGPHANGPSGPNGSGHVASSSSASTSSAATIVSGVLRPPPAAGPGAGAGTHDTGPLPASWASGPKPAVAAGSLGSVPGPPAGHAPPPGAMWGHFQPGGSTTPPLSAPQHHSAQPSRLDGAGAATDSSAGGGCGPLSHASLHGPGATQHPQPHTPYQTAAYRGAAAGRPTLFERVFGVTTEGCRFVAVMAEQGRLLVTESTGGGGGGSTCIRKISLVSPESSTRIRLPANAGLVTDLQLPPPSCGAAPSAQRLVAVVSRGAGLCLACPQADSVVASFTGLPAKAVSCSWVGSSSTVGGGSSSNSSGGSSSAGGHLLLAGLERGSLALLDVRRPDRPVAVMAALAHTHRCAQMPVRTVAALPSPPGLGAASASAGAALWPTCAISCPRGAWLMVPTDAAAGGADGGSSSGTGAPAGGSAAAPGTALLQLDGGFGAGGNMQIESLAVHWQGETASSVGDAASGLGSGGGGWRAALSWRPSDPVGGGGPVTAGPRHEVGRLQAAGTVPFVHEVTVSDYSRYGLQTVRSCLVPASSVGGAAAAEEAGLLLAASDDRTCTPLLWSLGGGPGPAGMLLQRLDPHPTAVNCLAGGAGAGGGAGGGSWFLACSSESRVAVYRRCE